MKQKSTIGFMITGMLFVLFLVLTVVVALVDVQPIGPLGSEVGLSTLNRWVFDRIGVHPAWETVTDLLGLVALACAAGFGVLGFCQLIKRKKLWKVDHELLVLGVFYCLVLSFYVLFEILVINNAIRRGIADGVPYSQLRTLIDESDFEPLIRDCVRLVENGTTTVDEAYRTINSTDA